MEVIHLANLKSRETQNCPPPFWIRYLDRKKCLNLGAPFYGDILNCIQLSYQEKKGKRTKELAKWKKYCHCLTKRTWCVYESLLQNHVRGFCLVSSPSLFLKWSKPVGVITICCSTVTHLKRGDYNPYSLDSYIYSLKRWIKVNVKDWFVPRVWMTNLKHCASDL